MQWAAVLGMPHNGGDAEDSALVYMLCGRTAVYIGSTRYRRGAPQAEGGPGLPTRLREHVRELQGQL
eukprot:13334968-Alexandrium_andersonii.AAC.1